MIELDQNLKPTGTIVFRDISDTMLVNSIAEGLGERSVLERDKKLGVENTTEIIPFWENSSWRFDEAGDNSFKREVLSSWGDLHNMAYLHEIELSLGVNLSAFYKKDVQTSAAAHGQNPLSKGSKGNPKLEEFMSTEYFKLKLRAYREKQRALQTSKMRIGS